MENLKIFQTDSTPHVYLDAENGEFEISGIITPEDVNGFFYPIFNWIEAYIKSPAAKTNVKINIQHFNIASSKRILFFLYKMNDLYQNGCAVKISWMYKENDQEMFEVGQDFDHMISVPFEYLSFKKDDILISVN